MGLNIALFMIRSTKKYSQSRIRVVAGMDSAVYFCADTPSKPGCLKEESHHEYFDLARSAACESGNI
jgi:hypothetical protein